MIPSHTLRPVPAEPARLRRGLFTLLVPVLFGAAACQDLDSPVSPAPRDAAPSASRTASGADAEVIPGRFIVTLTSGASPREVASAHGARPDYVYTHALNGFAGALSDAARDGLLRDSRVQRVEPDRRVTLSGVQTNATWGLDRIDQRAGTDGTFTYAYTGQGVSVYVIDTGIRYDHEEFGGRAVFGYDAFGGTGGDCNGHGTHVAGTVGGTRYGVAKAARLVAVRVLDCNGSGTWSGVIAGVDWVVGNRTLPAVANLSLGGGASSSVDDAVRRMISSGVATAVAAGNGNSAGVAQDACKYSPARVPEAMTISATNSSDQKTSWANYGDCVDWFAPGAGITSAWHTGSTATNTISGTSMATPHTAGVAALYLEHYPSAQPQAVRDALFSFATKGVVTSSKTSNNHLLFSNEEVHEGSGSTPCKPKGKSQTC